MLVYIDDITLFGTLDDIQAFKMQITMCYKVTDLGEVSHFLGLHNTCDHSKKPLSFTRCITSRECLHDLTCHTATHNTYHHADTTSCSLSIWFDVCTLASTQTWPEFPT